MPQFAANLSMMYPDMDFLDRFEAAAKDGFKAVEYLFPYAYAAEELAARLKGNGLQQVLFNMPPGGIDDASTLSAWEKGDRGTACSPGREAEYKESPLLFCGLSSMVGGRFGAVLWCVSRTVGSHGRLYCGAIWA